MSDNTLDLIGDKELMAQLTNLQNSAANKIMKSALKAGTVVIAKPIRRYARNGQFKSDTLAKMVKTRVWNRKSRRGDLIGKVYASPDTTDREIKVQGRIVPLAVAANIQEYGRKDGSLAPHKFFGPGYTEARGAAMAKIEEVARKKLEEMID